MKIMLTGPSYSGKTTTLNYLQSTLYSNPIVPGRASYIIHESAIQLIEALNSLCGVDRFSEWRKQYNAAWQSLVTTMQVDEELFTLQVMRGTTTPTAETKDDDVYYDSSPLDCLAYLEASGGRSDNYLAERCKMFATGDDRYYDLVFYHDLVEPFDDRSETGRIFSKEECLRVGKIQWEIYERYGMTPIRLPFLPVKDRVEIIRQHVLQKLEAR